MEIINYLARNPQIAGMITALIITIPIYAYYKTHGGTPHDRKKKEQWRMEWEAKQKRKQEPRQVFHHLTQAEFEKWKAERDKQEP